MQSAIRTEGLVKRFGKVEALSGLNLDIAPQSIFALVGPNGAGKTTAIKILTNILQPTAGTAEILGSPSIALKGRAFREIGYVSENQKLPDWMRVGAFLSYLRPFYPTWDVQLEGKLVRAFDLPLDRRLGALSRGMRMKAALAGSLAYRPKLLVLDEPLSGLDPIVREELVESLRERSAESTILISSHDLPEIEEMATHVGFLDGGRMAISEDLAGLQTRFRQVEIELDSEAQLVKPPWPDGWLQVRQDGTVIRFIESGFDLHTEQRIRAKIQSIRRMSFEALPLRSIFLATVRHDQKQS